jgi:hypothetical protein
MMSVWSEADEARLRSRYLGSEEDFEKLMRYLSTVWTLADVERLERSGRFVTWDEYFGREKVIRSGARPSG